MTVQGIGYPDWQESSRWASVPLVNLLNNPLGATYDTGVLYVGAWERLQFLFSPRTLGRRWEVAITWYGDPAGTIATGWADYKTATDSKIADAPPNMGPYVRLQVGCSSFAGNPTMDLIVTSRNGATRLVPPIDGWVTAELPSAVQAAGAVRTDNFSQVTPTVATFFAGASTLTWLAAIQYYDLLGGLHTLCELIGDGVRSMDTITVDLPGDSCVLVLNNIGAAPQTMLATVTFRSD